MYIERTTVGNITIDGKNYEYDVVHSAFRGGR